MIGLEGISARDLSELIGAIYDCSLDPQRWVETCRRIAAMCDSAAGGICVHDTRQVRNDQLFVFGYEQAFLECLGRQYAESPMAAEDILSDLGDVNALSMRRFQLHDSRFHREVMQPHGVLDMMWFPALRTGGRMASLHASRQRVSPYYSMRDIAFFELLAPHVCRALTISDALDIRALKSKALEQTLDRLASGVFLTAGDGHVVYMNTAAERQVRAATAMRIVNNRLHPTDQSARAALDLAIQKAGQAQAGVDAANHSIAIPDSVGGGFVATLLSVTDGCRSDVFAPFFASVAVFVQDPVDAPIMPAEAFGRLYRLTGGELRVLMALSQGLGGMEVAAMLGVGEPTIRTHLQRIYSKTGTSKQSDLLRLWQHSTPPMRRGSRISG